jgi:hypothetical protein
MQQSHRTRKQTVCLGSTLVPEPPRRQVSAPNRSGRGKHTFVSGSFHAKTQAYILLGPPDVRDRIVYVEPDLSENEQIRLGRGGGNLPAQESRSGCTRPRISVFLPSAFRVARIAKEKKSKAARPKVKLDGNHDYSRHR